MKKWLPFVCLAAFCSTASPAAAGTPRFIEGRLTFQDANSDGSPSVLRPIRFVTVTMSIGSHTVATATTDSGGFWTASVDSGLLPASAHLTTTFNSENFAASVKLDTDYFDDSLTWAADTVIPAGTGDIAIDRSVGIDEFSQHFSILDAITVGREFADARRADSDDIDTVDAQYPDADWTNYSPGYFSGGTITIAGPASHGYGGNATDHGFADSVILHEYGHHLEYQISDVDGDEVQQHTTCDDDGYGFAWAEGWATYFAASVRANSPQLLSSTFPNLERDSGCPRGSEAVTSQILWDLSDPANESDDVIDGNILIAGKPLKDVLFAIFDLEQDDLSVGRQVDTDPLTSILSFHDHLVARNLAEIRHADIDRVYHRNGLDPHNLADYRVDAVSLPAHVKSRVAFPVQLLLANGGANLYPDTGVVVGIFIGSTLLDSVTLNWFTGTQLLTRSVTLPTGTPEGTITVTARIDYVDSMAEQGEANNVASATTSFSICGNFRCGFGETCSTCPTDCGSCCGDGICSPQESERSCPQDCEGKPPPCFAAGTPITLADGSHKPIERIQAGDRVLSYDEARGVLVEGDVLRTFEHPDSDNIVILNNSLVTTNLHRFWSDGHWIAAQDLSVGAPLLSSRLTGDAATPLITLGSTVKQLEARAGSITTYNFEVGTWHDYFAGDLLVHNMKQGSGN